MRRLLGADSLRADDAAGGRPDDFTALVPERDAKLTGRVQRPKVAF
jgi:hypothetical protein